MESLTLRVEGMSCGGCVLSVEKALLRVDGVKRVDVSLAEHSAKVEGANLDEAILRSAVEGAGYEVSTP